ncbi:hypothetical protein Gp_12 [Bacillus phage vB_Bacillus_1020A]|nr:hypothetical protein Gp_12 [Bacillus phage vB_Bacillus_1020A]
MILHSWGKVTRQMVITITSSCKAAIPVVKEWIGTVCHPPQ